MCQTMSLYVKILASVACCLLLLSHLTTTSAQPVERTKRDVSDPLLTIDVLEGLVDSLKDRLYSQQQKRRFDAGYGGRFGVAHSVGSKLMALKQAADWNGPGKMKGEFMADDGRRVDYAALRQSPLFGEYKTQVVDLHSVKLEELSREQKMAFCINVYNSLTIHGLAECRELPKSVLDIQQFWKVTAYQIGDHVFSLDDLEHGILRGNRPHPASNRPHFEETDPRLKLSLQQVDPRIHFTLVCGAKSCPSISVYTAENLEKALEGAAQSFCRQEVKVYEVQRKISISQLFQWYGTDFGQNDVEAIRWTVPYLEQNVSKALRNLLYLLEHEGMVDIEYRPYNWELNQTEA